MRQRCHKKLLVQKERTYDVNSTATAQSPLSARPTTAAQSSPVRLLRDQRSRRAWWRREVTMSLGTRTHHADATRGTRRIYCKANLLSKPHQQPVYFRPGTTKRRKKARKMKGNGTARNVEISGSGHSQLAHSHMCLTRKTVAAADGGIYIGAVSRLSLYTRTACGLNAAGERFRGRLSLGFGGLY